jgi:hypothetical protein
MSKSAEALSVLLGTDPIDWLLQSDEASARWMTLTGVLDRPEDDEDVAAARAQAIASSIVQDLIGRIQPWGEGPSISGHNSPAYLPNQLQFLADLGVRRGDDPRIETALDELSNHQREDGRFLAFGRAPKQKEPRWGSLPCDTHSITEVLVRFGRFSDPPARGGMDRIARDLTVNVQGAGWTCIPDPEIGFRGPGRRGDICPQVNLEALRMFARVPSELRPSGLEEAARTLMRVWDGRGGSQPYMFGHGYRFKTVKWPPLWYGAYWMLDTLGRYPSLWSDGRTADRRSLAEMVKCLIAYNFAKDGTVTPGSVYRGFESFSFGQKKQPSPIATAMLATVIRRFSDLTADIAAVDVGRLASSKGGSGTPRLPRR